MRLATIAERLLGIPSYQGRSLRGLHRQASSDQQGDLVRQQRLLPAHTQTQHGTLRVASRQG